MNRKWLLGAAIVLGLILFFVVFQFFPFGQFLNLIFGIEIHLILFYLLVSFAIFVVHSYRWLLICEKQDVKIPFMSLLSYKFVGHAISFMTPGPKVGGEPARAALVKRNGYSFSKGLATVLTDKTIEFSSFGVMFVISLIFVLLTLNMTAPIRTIVTIVLTIVLVLLGYGFYQMINGKDPVMKIFNFCGIQKIRGLRKYKKEIANFEKQMVSFYSQDKKTFWQSQALSAIAWLMSILEFKLILLMLGFSPSFIEIFLIFSIVGVAYMIPIPLALGSLDALQASLFVGLRMPAAAGAALALITRTRDILWTLVGFVLLGYFGFDKLNKK